MRKQSKRNKLFLTRTFQEGRIYFPREEFDKLTYLNFSGYPATFAAKPINKEACNVEAGINFETEAEWGE